MFRRAALLALTATAVPLIALAQGAPSAEQLGVPVYPGATYDARNSQGMSQPTEKYYIFTTPDSLRAVVAFCAIFSPAHAGSPTAPAATVQTLRKSRRVTPPVSACRAKLLRDAEDAMATSEVSTA